MSFNKVCVRFLLLAHIFCIIILSIFFKEAVIYEAIYHIGII